jgi:peptide chain release factor 2
VKQQIARLEEETTRPGFWDEPREAQETIQQLNALRQRIAGWEELERQWQELQAMSELLQEEEDTELLEELQQGLQELAKRLDTLEMETLLSGEHDANNAILEINAGAGGTESCDWVQMLLRMYLRWAQEHGFRTEILDETPGEVAGLKSVTVRVEGRNAYGLLESERGVHRLVRISPFDANKRRHTSFASVDVIPELPRATRFKSTRTTCVSRPSARAARAVNTCRRTRLRCASRTSRQASWSLARTSVRNSVTATWRCAS